MPQMRQRRGNRNDLIGSRGVGQREKNPDHIASSATPQATQNAAAQRCHVTDSFSTMRASTVSSTTLAAVAGTAKLRSANESSFMNAKKEIAIMKTATTMGARRAMPDSTLIQRLGRSCSV